MTVATSIITIRGRTRMQTCLRVAEVVIMLMAGLEAGG